MNAFRTLEGKLDRQYLRVCAVYKFLKQGRVGKARAVELMKARQVTNAQATVEVWLNGPFKNLKVGP